MSAREYVHHVLSRSTSAGLIWTKGCSMKCLFRSVIAAGLTVWVQAGFPNDQLDYERRVGSRYATLFESLDLNRDAMVSREEARGDLNFMPSFDDIDVNRDGLVTRDELRAYLERRYGLHAADAGPRAIAAGADKPGGIR